MENIVKEEVIAWITQPENEDLLKVLKQIKDSATSKDWYEKLSKHSKQSIKKGKKNHNEGNTLTNKDFWLKHG